MARSLSATRPGLPQRSILTWVFVARLSVANALALAVTVVRSTGLDGAPALPLVLWIVGVPVVFTILSIAFMRSHRPGNAFIVAQIVHDLLLVTGAVILTGGVGSEFVMIFVPLIAVAALLFGISGAVMTAFGSVTAYLAIAYRQIVPLLPAADGTIDLPNVSGPVAAILWSVALTAAVLMLVGLASGVVADRLRSQRARLEELEQRLAVARIDAQDILDSVESGILSVGADGEIDFINYTARAQLGVTRSPTAEDLRRRGDRTAIGEIYAMLHTTLTEEHEVEFAEVALPTADGEQKVFGVSTTLLYDAAGRKRGAAAILKDMANVKRLEELARQTDRLRAITELAAGLAHEIQNPLAAIRSSIELMGGDGPESVAEDERLRSLVVRETDRLTELISDFMAFSRMSLRTRERLDLCDVVEDALEVERATSGAEGDPIRFIRPQRAYPVEGDHNLLKQVCLNLFANARTAVEGGGECRIEVRVGGSAELPGLQRVAGPFVALEVRDNGAGVDPDVQDRIFDPFFTTRPTGFGMGLAIVHRIVDLHGGMVWVDSTPGRGSIFRVALPRHG